ncbi:MAG TPA: lysylphosphatidylglycerol synthase transmembrane domain-containing protein, partial [Prolixibacteraceae bacterium]|nr:lysylphosphatidylglycerol synthase transmembrane domain-containing protein [Prolixibacteraceae bacterium]
MKKKIFNILKYIIFTALGIGMFWLVYRDQDFSEIWHTLSNEVNYTWVFISLSFGLLSHISRTLRWKIALEPLGEKPRTSNSFIAVMSSYFMNLLLPRMGEFVRCALITKYEKIPFSKLFGTVVTERIVDMVMLLVLFVSVIVLEFDKIISFGNDNPLVVENIKNIIHSPLLWGIFVISVLAFLFYVRLGKKSGKKNKIQAVISDFALGIKSILSMRRYKAYIAHTVFIWFMYYLM